MTRPGTRMPRRFASAYRRRVSSAATMSAPSMRAIRRADASPVLPIGVAASTTVPRGMLTSATSPSSPDSARSVFCAISSVVSTFSSSDRSLKFSIFSSIAHSVPKLASFPADNRTHFCPKPRKPVTFRRNQQTIAIASSRSVANKATAATTTRLTICADLPPVVALRRTLHRPVGSL